MIKNPFIPACAVACLLSGCASSTGSHELLSAPLNARVGNYADLAISVKPVNNVKLTQPDTDRLNKQISEALKTEAPTRFKSINAASPGPTTLAATVDIKRYDEGNAFARFMLAGLGQMHIDADVMLSDPATEEILAKYEVTKTFGWGGLYGASTGIKDVEVGFCKAAANAILGKD